MTGRESTKQRNAGPEDRDGVKPTARTVMWHQVPKWQQDNKYIVAGYRTLEADYLQVIKSLTFLHNETCNVYTHLIGAVMLPCFATTILRTVYGVEYMNGTTTDLVMFGIFFCSAECCLTFSVIYHLVGSHSHKVEQFYHQMDLLGIVIFTAGSLIPGIQYIFDCEPLWRKLHWTIVLICGSATAALVFMSNFRTSQRRKARITAFVAFGASAFIPLLHGIQIHGLKYMLDRLGLKCYLIELFIYGVGCGLYTFRIPERFAPGRFDMWLSSHQIFHVSILCAIYTHTIALMQSFTTCRTSETCNSGHNFGL